MKKGIIGKKIGMTQIFDAKGNAIPVTVIEAGPCAVTQIKTTEKDGYEAVQLGFVPLEPLKTFGAKDRYPKGEVRRPRRNEATPMFASVRFPRQPTGLSNPPASPP